MAYSSRSWAVIEEVRSKPYREIGVIQLAGSLTRPYSASFFIQSRPAQGMVPLPVVWALLHHLTVKTVPIDMPTGQSDLSSPSVDTPFLGDLGYFKLTIKTNFERRKIVFLKETVSIKLF